LPEKKPIWAWSTSRRRYYHNGRAVPEKRVRDGVQQAVASSKDRISEVTQKLIDGKINLAEWEVTMRQEIRAGHRAVILLANGGKLPASARSKLGNTVKQQYKYLAAFRNQLESGDLKLGKGTLARARLYPQAFKTSYENAVVGREKSAGVLKGKWRLSAAEHCAGCLYQAKRGVQPLESFPPLGSNECFNSCLCIIQAV
jgi:hypothetical protein